MLSFFTRDSKLPQKNVTSSSGIRFVDIDIHSFIRASRLLVEQRIQAIFAYIISESSEDLITLLEKNLHASSSVFDRQRILPLIGIPAQVAG